MTLRSKDLAGMKEAEINKKIADLKKELIKHAAQSATGTALKNPYIIKNTRKDIARMMTELTRRKTADEPTTAKTEKPKEEKSA